MILLILISIKFVLGNNSSFSLEISKSKSFNTTDSIYYSFLQIPNTKPFVIKMKSENKEKIVKGVDIIALVDNTQSMTGTPFELAKLSLKYLINIMNENDNFCLVTFSYFTTLVYGLNKTAEENKKIIIDKIDNLEIENYTDIYIHGGIDNGTDIMEGLKFAMEQITQNYSSGERIASIFVLTDGYFSYYYDFDYDENEEFIKKKKKNSTFTIHYIGLSNFIFSSMLHMVSIIRDGSYFFIPEIYTIKNVISKLYNSLTVVDSVNIKLFVESPFKILYIYGVEGIKNDGSLGYSYKYELIHFLYNTTYTFIILLIIPDDIKIGDIVLKASISPLNINKTYTWDTKIDQNTYEDMIKYIFLYYVELANENSRLYDRIIDAGENWFKDNYNGTKNWIKELNEVKNDLKTVGPYYEHDYKNRYGHNNAYARLREMTSSKIGLHYRVEEIKGKFYYYIDNEEPDDLIYQNIKTVKIVNETNLPYELDKNYYFYKITKGYGEINKIYFNGNSEIYIIIYTEEKSGSVNIKSLSEYIEYTCWNESRIRNINNFDLNQGGKFISQKDSPLEFYSEIDGNNDINFNIQFLKLEENKIEIKIYLIEIIAYIVDEDEKDILNIDKNYIPNKKVYNGSYNNELKLGFISIKKEEILKYINNTYKSYIYVIINKSPSISANHYSYIEGQFLFSSPNYINTQVPEDFIISNYFFSGENSPHLYSLIMEPSLGKCLTIELIIFGIELDIRILKYNNDTNNLEDLYTDCKDYKIRRRENNNIQYIDIYQSTDINTIFYYIIISIFPKNKEHIAESNIQKFLYSFKYITYSYNKQRYNISDIEDDHMIDNQNNNTINNNTENNIISNSTELEIFTDLETNIKKNTTTYKLIILGFSQFIHIKIIKICHFSLHFADINQQHIHDLNLYISIIIRYKINLNIIQEIKQIKCILIKNNEDNIQINYNCSFETNGNDIYNVQLINQFKFDENDIEIIGYTPYANKYINNITNIRENNIFIKRLYILSNIIIIINNKNNEFNITGNILNYDRFNYQKINLMINLLSLNYSIIDITYISCNVIKLKENNNYYIFQCFSEKEIFGTIDGAFAELEDANMVIMPGDNNTLINFTKKIEKIDEKKITKNYRTKSKGGLSTGGKLAIIFSIIGVVAAVGIEIVLIKTKTIVLYKNSDSVKDIIVNNNY